MMVKGTKVSEINSFPKFARSQGYMDIGKTHFIQASK